MLFEGSISNEIMNSYIKDLVLSLDDNWKNILEDPFVVSTVLPKMQFEDLVIISKLLTNDLINNQTVLKDTFVLDCRALHETLLFVLVQKLRKSLKQKDENSSSSQNGVSIFEDMFSSNDKEDYMLRLIDIFSRFNFSSVHDRPYKLNINKLQSYLNVMCSLPVTFMSYHVQIGLFIYLALYFHHASSCETFSKDIKVIIQNIMLGK